MFETGKPSERNRFTFEIAAEILQELNKPTGIVSISSNCNVSFKESMCRLVFMKSSDITPKDAVMAVAIECYKDTYFESRKRRPQERGRKKRRKGRWDPIDRLWNSASSKNCSSGHLLDQD